MKKKKEVGFALKRCNRKHEFLSEKPVPLLFSSALESIYWKWLYWKCWACREEDALNVCFVGRHRGIELVLFAQEFLNDLIATGEKSTRFF